MVAEDQLRLLHYHCQRVMLVAFAGTGRAVTVRRTRQGNTRIALDGGRELCVRDAMERVERILTKENAWPHAV